MFLLTAVLYDWYLNCVCIIVYMCNGLTYRACMEVDLSVKSAMVRIRKSQQLWNASFLNLSINSSAWIELSVFFQWKFSYSLWSWYTSVLTSIQKLINSRRRKRPCKLYMKDSKYLKRLNWPIHVSIQKNRTIY